MAGALADLVLVPSWTKKRATVTSFILVSPWVPSAVPVLHAVIRAHAEDPATLAPLLPSTTTPSVNVRPDRAIRAPQGFSRSVINLLKRLSKDAAWIAPLRTESNVADATPWESATLVVAAATPRCTEKDQSPLAIARFWPLILVAAAPKRCHGLPVRTVHVNLIVTVLVVHLISSLSSFLLRISGIRVRRTDPCAHVTQDTSALAVTSASTLV